MLLHLRLAGPSSGPASPDAGFAAFTKPGGSPARAINLTAAAGPASGSPTALPAHLFAEPALPPAYGSTATWGTHLAGVSPKPPLAGAAAGTPSGGSSPGRLKAVAADDAFAEFDPFGRQ